MYIKVLTKKHGFTIMEMILAIAFVGLVVAIALPFAVSYQSSEITASIADEIESVLNKAKTYAQSGKADTVWGVFMQGGSMTLFSGATYDSRDQQYDEKYDLLPGATVHGLSEVVFEKIDGSTQATGTITLETSGKDNVSFLINETGIITEIMQINHHFFVNANAATTAGFTSNQLIGISLENASSTEIEVAAVIVSSTRTGRTISSITFDGSTVYSGTGNYDESLLLTSSNRFLSANTNDIPVIINFDQCMNDTDELNIQFILSDGSIKETQNIVIGGTCFGGKVICTELYRQGKISKELFLADQTFSETLSPKILDGYRFWAEPVVLLMQRSESISNIVAVIAMPWIHEMAYKMGERDEGSRIGAALFKAGSLFSYGVYEVHSFIEKRTTNFVWH